jgi:hypothetical protein
VHGDCCIDQQVLQLHGLDQVCVPHQAAVTGLQTQTHAEIHSPYSVSVDYGKGHGHQVGVPHQAAVTGLQRQTQDHTQQFECDVDDRELQSQDMQHSFVGWYELHTRLRPLVCDQEKGRREQQSALNFT